MKILYVGNTQGLNNMGQYYLTSKRLTNGFIRLGHNVCFFNDRDHARYLSPFRSQSSGKTKMNKKLIESCDIYKPDLIVLSHCKNVTNESLDQIRNLLPNVKIIYTNVDPLSVQQNIDDIFQRVPSADRIFVTTAGRALNKFEGGRARCHFFPNPVDPSIDTKIVPKNEEADVDLLFLGRALNHQHDHRKELAKYLTAHLPNDVNVYIGGLGINKKTIYGDDYLQLLGHSKMGVCINKTQEYYLYASDRMSHYMAAGIMVFSAEGPKFEDVLGQNSFVSFSSPGDLLDKVIYYKKNSEERKEIALNGHKIIHDLFNNEKICQFIIDITFDQLHKEIPIWHHKDIEARR